ncbi:MAG: hypothetical protein JWN43_3219 [Gammaproteobacteria bacterium]|nr:hypothetical protein [Gammaproteobacteria bacterium]
MRTRVEIFQQRGQLLARRLYFYETIPQCLLPGMPSKIPTQVLTCHSNTRLIAVKGVQVFEVGAHNITDTFQR